MYVTLKGILKANVENVNIRMFSLKSFTKYLYPDVSTRVIIPFLLIILIVAGIGTFIVTRLVAGTIDERLNNQLADGAQTASNVITDIEREYLAILRLMTFTQGVAEAVVAGNTVQIDRLLNGIAVNQNVDELLVFDSTGRNIYRLSSGADTLAQLVDISTWDIVQNIVLNQPDALGDKFVNLFLIDERQFIFFSAPIYDVSGQLIGGVAIGLSSERFVQRISEQALTTLILIDRTGQVIDSTIRSLVEPVPTDFLVVPSVPDEQLFLESPIEEREVDGVTYRFLHTRLELRARLVGALSVGLPTRFVAERIGTSRDSFAILFGLMFVAVTSTGILISRSIIRPLTRIVDTTRAISGGDLSKRVQLRMPDELGALSQSFDTMTDQLVLQNKKIKHLYQEQLIETARREAMLTSISDIIIVQDMSGREIFSNPRAKKFKQALRLNPADRRLFGSMVKEPDMMNEPRTVKLATRHYSALATPVGMPTGEKLGYVIFLRDITDLIEAEHLKDEMILQLSHELKTPYATAYSYAELMQLMVDTNKAEKALTYPKEIIYQLSLLGNMIERVIEVSAILANQIDLDIVQFDFLDILRELLPKHQSNMESSEITYHLVVQDDAIPIEGDQVHLTRALEAIIENAYQYTLPGGSVAIRVRSNEQYVVFECKDTGVGIPSNELAKVFNRMYRGTSADAGPTDTRGLGLGLYISKQLVEAHHGKIELKSVLNVGTLIRVRLPINASEL